MKSYEQLFEPKDFLRITEETQQRIQYWVLNGLINPHHPGSGIGTSRIYSTRNLIEVAVVQALAKTGLYIKSYTFYLNIIEREIPRYFIDTDNATDPEKQLWLFIEIFGIHGSNRSYVVPFHELKSMLSNSHEGVNPKILLNLDSIKHHMLKRIEEKKN